MSLNCREIDEILAELRLDGMKIERVFQPSYDTVILGLYGGGRSLDLLVSIAHGACRIHSVTKMPAKNERPLRFMECLRSQVRGARIAHAAQIGRERVVKLNLDLPGSDSGTAVMYIRLWSGAGNIVLADSGGTIIDAMARKPSRGEVSGLPCTIEADLAARELTGSPEREFHLRDLPGEGSFEKRIEAFYAERGAGLSREKLLETAKERFERRMRILDARNAEYEARAAEFRDAARQRELGDILMAGYGTPLVRGNSAYVLVQDFYRGGEVSVRIDPSLGNVPNAQAYYEKYRKASSGLAEVEEELARTRASITKAQAWIARAEAEQDPFAIARMLAKAGTVREKHARKSPGLAFALEGWSILVGRSGAENDELLRKNVRGSDMWMHARDRSGSYVFIKAVRGKSIPLPVLLDAGMLALYYSKARADGEGDLYYTPVKYLRRVKDGPKGLVIPTLEKNLFVRIDENRLKILLALSEGQEDTV